MADTTITPTAASPHDTKASLDCCAQDLTTSIHHTGEWFKDVYGRTLLMRGVNACGSSKLPTAPFPGSTHLYDEKLFWDHRHVSFVGRPFPLAKAPEHLARLRAWGLTLIRLLVPWEAIEHAGPGNYDEEYIDYLRSLIALMPQYGIKCFIDPHQDAWSRFCGGSGAPGWTFEVAGLNIKTFKETGAAFVHNTNASTGVSIPMIWPTNYTKLACATMYTLFFAGDTFAPNKVYQGKSIQQFLNDSFIEAYRYLAERLNGLKAILGFEFLNEPNPGYINLELNEFDSDMNIRFGDAPNPLQCFALGDGIPQTVDVYEKSWPALTKKVSEHVVNTEKVSAWLDEGKGCIWKEHGVWKLDEATGEPVMLDSTYFCKHPQTGENISFHRDFYLPMVNRYAAMIQNVNNDWFIVVDPSQGEAPPQLDSSDHHYNVIYSPHWYDLNCLISKKFKGYITQDDQVIQKGGNKLQSTYFGRNGAKKNYRGQFKNIQTDGLKRLGPKPSILGEVGIPMDLNDGVAFKTGDYSKHLQLFDAIMYGLETNLMNFCLWNYDIYNDHEHGDQWNSENLSIFSNDELQQDVKDDTYFYNGGRVLKAILRPYASKVAGHPLSSEFNMDTKKYEVSFIPFSSQDLETLRSSYRTSEKLARTTEIFMPFLQYGNEELNIQASRGQFNYDKENQTLSHYYDADDDKTPIHITVQLPHKSSCNVM